MLLKRKMGTEQTRAEKMQWVESYINKYFKRYPDSLISYKNMSAIFCMHFDSSKKTFKEIIEILERTKIILVKGDEIKLR